MQRMNDLDRAKGLAILLVVFGHIMTPSLSESREWFLSVKYALYGFHMPFFMYISGFVLYLKTKPANSLNAFATFSWSRATRLLPSFFLFALIVYLAKMVAQPFLYVDNPVSSFQDLLNIFLFPMESVSRFLWYIYILFLFSVVSFALYSISGSLVLPVIFSVVIHMAPEYQLLGAGQFTKYFVFFMLGALASHHTEPYLKCLDKFWFYCFFAFAILLIYGLGGIHKPEITLLGLLAIPSLHGFVRWLNAGKLTAIFEYCGNYVFSIYLLNTMALGLVKAVLFLFVSFEEINFILFLLVLFISGVSIPIAVKKILFSRIKWLDRITS